MRFILLLFLVFLIMVSCHESESSDNYKVFRYNQASNITSLDPAFARSQNNIWAVDHLYNGLVGLNKNMEIVPSIAKEWEISNLGRSYTFYLRSDVYFHKNPCFPDSIRKVIAADFKYSFERIISDEVNSPGSWIFNGKVRELDPFEVVNDSTFSVHLQNAFVPFLGILTMQYCSVIPHEAVDYYATEFRANPVGTGPFKMKKWIENQGIFLSRNPHYFLGASSLDGIKISLISDRKTAYLEFAQGNLDFLSGLESSFINDLLNKNGTLRAHHKNQIELHSHPFLNTEYLGINLEAADSDSPLHSKIFRQALNYAIDRERMLRTLRNNIGAPAISGFIPKGLPAYNDSINVGYSYNMSKAKSLIDSFIMVNGDVKPIVLHTNKDYVDICTFLVYEWSKIGIECSIVMEESALLREGMRNGSISFFRASWIADYPDEESFLNVFYGASPSPPNYTRFRNDYFDQLYETYLSVTDDQKRQAAYQEMNQIIIENAPVIFLFYDETATFNSKRVSGLELNSMKLLKVNKIEINE